MTHIPSPPDELHHLDQLDPARSLHLSSARLARRDAEFERIVSIEHPVPGRSRTRRRLAIGLTSAAAFAIVGAIVVTAMAPFTHTSVSSYALPAHGSLSSWTPESVPVSVSSDEIQACVSELGFPATDQTPVALTSDRRGDFTSVFVEQGSNDGYCVMADGAVENSINFEGLASHPLDDPNSAVISVIQGGSWMFVASGHAGQNVRTLTVKNPDTGENVTAAVAKGVWSAWWPVGPDSPALKGESQNEDYVNDVSISYVTSDGVSRSSDGVTRDGDGAGDAEPSTPSAPVVLGILAGWDAATQTVVPAVSDVDTCASVVDGWPSGSATTVIGETRGDFESLVLERGGVDVTCVLKAGVVQWSTDTGHVSTDPVAAGEAAFTSGQGFDWIGGDTRVTQMRGIVGAGVTAVTVHLAGGHDVQAAVQNGEWMAWWPEEEPPALGGPTPTPTDGTLSAAAPAPAGTPPFSWTTTDGVTHDSTTP
jgi:hypothetical protein